MKVYPNIYEYIEEGGGPQAFDPTTQPDNFLDLCQQILEVLSNGSETVKAAIPQEELDWNARYYLGLPDPTNQIV